MSLERPAIGASHKDIMKGLDHIQPKIAEHVSRILELLGFDEFLLDPSMCDTPERVARMLLEYRQPLNPVDLFKTFDVAPGYHEMVIQKHVPFSMLCEHHLLPAMGHAAVGYLPYMKVIGLSKIPRLVRAVGFERPSLQERIGERICDLMEEHLSPRGVAVVIEAEHGCVACRGVKSPGIRTVSSHIRGAFRDNHVARQEFLSLVNIG